MGGRSFRIPLREVDLPQPLGFTTEILKERPPVASVKERPRCFRYERVIGGWRLASLGQAQQRFAQGPEGAGAVGDAVLFGG